VFELRGGPLGERPGVGRLGFVPMAESEELLTVAEITASLEMNQQRIRNWI
jgi:hypothetical protein